MLSNLLWTLQEPPLWWSLLHKSLGQGKSSLDNHRLIDANPASLAQLRDVSTGHLIEAPVMKDQIFGNRLDGVPLDPASKQDGEQFCMT